MAKTKEQKWSITFPKELTVEEKELKLKYETLRNLKLKLLEKGDNREECMKKQDLSEKLGEKNQNQLKTIAAKIINSKGGVKGAQCDANKTAGFKRIVKQDGQNQVGHKRCAMSEYTPETASQPRSVTVRAPNLTQESLLKTFKRFGDIWKIRIGQNNQSAVVTFKNSESAFSASENSEIVVGEDKKLYVELFKKRNCSWVDVAAEDGKNAKLDCSSSEKRTVHVAYQGNMTIQDFRDVFRGCGKIEKIYISARDDKSRLRRQFAFVTYRYEEDALRAIEKLNGEVHNGIPLKVSPQKSSKKDNDSSVGMAKSVILHQENDDRTIVTYDNEGE